MISLFSLTYGKDPAGLVEAFPENCLTTLGKDFWVLTTGLIVTKPKSNYCNWLLINTSAGELGLHSTDRGGGPLGPSSNRDAGVPSLWTGGTGWHRGQAQIAPLKTLREGRYCQF